MNVLLWILQALLGTWYLIGGLFVISHFDQVRGPWTATWPNSIGIVYGALQFAFALQIFYPKTSRTAAATLAVLALAGCGLFAQFAGFPGMLWGVIPAILCAFTAYGRTSLSPFKKS